MTSTSLHSLFARLHCWANVGSLDLSGKHEADEFQGEKEISKHVAQGAIRRIMSHYAGKRQSGLGAIDDMQNANIV